MRPGERHGSTVTALRQRFLNYINVRRQLTEHPGQARQGVRANIKTTVNVITLSTPFVYNPTLRSLLIDFQSTGLSGTAGSLDDALFPFPPGGGIATVGGTIGTATGTFVSQGHILQVGYTGCSYGPNSPGQAFPAAGGTANVTVNTPAGCSWSISGLPNWVTPSALSGSGTTALSFQVTANAGADQSTTFTIADLSFTIQLGFAFPPRCTHDVHYASRTRQMTLIPIG